MVLLTIWNCLWRPLAWLGGCRADKLYSYRAGDCGKVIAVGLLFLVSMAGIDTGYTLFFGRLPGRAEQAVALAAVVTAILAIVYGVALRHLPLMSPLARAVTTVLVGGIMGVNTVLSGHELVIFLFPAQVEAETKLAAAKGVQDYAATIESSLGLPDLRSRAGDLDKSLTAANGERGRVPEIVGQLRKAASGCETEAARLSAQIPPEGEADYDRARSIWREKQARCRSLAAQAEREQAQHLKRMDALITELNSRRTSTIRGLEEANGSHERTLARDTPALTDNATSGFARHDALWRAVAKGTVPGWAAYGLMAIALIVEAFAFAMKQMLRADRCSRELEQEVQTDALIDAIDASYRRQQRRLVPGVMRARQATTQADLEALVNQLVVPAAQQAVQTRSFERAAQAPARASNTSMVERLARMAARRAAAAGGGHTYTNGKMPGGAAPDASNGQGRGRHHAGGKE